MGARVKRERKREKNVRAGCFMSEWEADEAEWVKSESVCRRERRNDKEWVMDNDMLRKVGSEGDFHICRKKENSARSLLSKTTTDETAPQVIAYRPSANRKKKGREGSI
jgi:hypothetical protein